MSVRIAAVSAVVSAALLLAAVAPSAAADEAGGDPYGADPLGLIARFDQTSADSVGDDRWEVWVCRVGADSGEGEGGVGEGKGTLTPERAVRYLNWELGRWFGWLSGDRYRISFSPGGTVAAPYGTWPVSQQPCVIRVLSVMAFARVIADPDTGADAPDGVLVIVDDAHAGGYACNRCYRDFDRVAVVGGGTIAAGGAGASAGAAEPAVGAIAHQIAHTLGFPHSSGGRFGADARDHELDNPMDFMGGGAYGTATPAVNRYAASWIDPAEVAVHDAAMGSYELIPITGTGKAGTEMLVIPLGEPGRFAALGARVSSGYDAAGAEGVEVYLVDQRAGACGLDPGSGAVCWGENRVTRPAPAARGSAVGHVLRVGDVVRLGEVTVHVTQRSGDAFRLVAFSGDRFTDDGGSHEDAIEAVARAGITLGCNPPANDRYCPRQPVTRAQMAALLARGLPDVPDIDRPVGIFGDVPTDAWYAPAVEALHASGVVSGYPDGTYRPRQPVTRAQMAALLARGLPDTPANHQPVGVFTDVPADAWYAPAAEALHASGVTRGCTADAFCPRALVSRAQAAAFLARALDLKGYDDPAIIDALAELEESGR